MPTMLAGPLIGLMVLPSLPAFQKPSTIANKRASIVYEGVDGKVATAIAKTVEAAWAVANEDFAFDLPERIYVDIRMDPKGGRRLFNDGKDRLFLAVDEARAFDRPSKSGTFHLYGICHEIGHLAMYRPISDHSWLTSDAAEGWAHYIGSRMVDGVYRKRGPELWPDAYDYREDGTARLERQLKADRPSAMTRAASHWKQFGELVGDHGMSRVFVEWGKATIDPTNPGTALRKALLAAVPPEKKKAAEAWWKEFEPTFVIRQKRSGVVARTIKPGALSGRPLLLSQDDGQPAGKKSMAGSGHAVRFNAPGTDWYLTEVRLHGARYGTVMAPREDLHVWLCDDAFNVIADFKQPYSKFERGEPSWVTLKVKPMRVPATFFVCVGFNPTATKGVYVSRDGNAGGASFFGLPGKQPVAFEEGDWLIRAGVDRPKTAEALEGG